ncbi:hypothetical protein EXIGLDRAFT_183138 [Exidia glandulosa HHB12029]|uniref:Uncharacterized protein n=1 Tax=Exidia glandulosa HHB12029 TaxID=1314781 RepID=A0A165F2B6_EXIGL|nr:hypothetical protein EXIGLDRAFT_183138 [Exidia glandulosa HHB12029]
MASIPLSQPPALNGTSAPSSPSTHIPLSWEHDKMLNIYIHDYFVKHGFTKAANELCLEADLDPNGRKPPIDAPQGLLYEWWVVFWEIFQAKSSKAGKQDAQTYLEHQTRMRNQGVGVVQPQHPMQPGMPVPQGQPIATSMQRTIINPGMQPQGQQQRPPGMGMPGQPIQMMPNGAGPHNPQQQPGMSNGTMQPGQPGQYAASPGMVNGVQSPMSGQPQARPGAGMGMGMGMAHMQTGQPMQYTSPVMANAANPGGMPQQRPQPQMMPRPGMAIHPNAQQQQAGMMQQPHPSQMQQPPYGARPASRAGTPGGGVHPQMTSSPRMISRQFENTWQNEFIAMVGQLPRLSDPHFNQLRAMAGLSEKDDVHKLTDDQKRALLGAYKQQLGPGAQIIPIQAQRPPDPNTLQRGAGIKRSSTSPGDEGEAKDASPPSKRMRPSPPPGSEGNMVMLSSNGQPVNGMIAPRQPPPLGGPPNGMQGQPMQVMQGQMNPMMQGQPQQMMMSAPGGQPQQANMQHSKFQSPGAPGQQPYGMAQPGDANAMAQHQHNNLSNSRPSHSSLSSSNSNNRR